MPYKLVEFLIQPCSQALSLKHVLIYLGSIQYIARHVKNLPSAGARTADSSLSRVLDFRGCL